MLVKQKSHRFGIRELESVEILRTEKIERVGERERERERFNGNGYRSVQKMACKGLKKIREKRKMKRKWEKENGLTDGKTYRERKRD